uniref:Ribonuclease Oy-like n=1 Tax=Crassostrea virginica TaxID=6565 RepID=A0A8B8AGF4_CRAVI|nr:ribonuclease Oy-like [Crassostrea virginica]
MVQVQFAGLYLLAFISILVTEINGNDGAFKLALEWPNSFCIEQKSKCKENLPSDWIIHGLWPKSKVKSRYMFNLSDISNHTRKLMKNWWPSITNNRTDEDLWRHEWEKHGIFAKENGSDMTLTQYFEKTIHLKTKYSISQFLEMCNITPLDSNLYRVEEIKLCIFEKTKHVPFICQRCEKYMLEVRICLDKRFVAVNCSDANNGMKLLYPKTVSASRIFQSNKRTGACTTCSDQIQIKNSDLVGRSKYSSLEFSYLWLLLSLCSWCLLF